MINYCKRRCMHHTVFVGFIGLTFFKRKAFMKKKKKKMDKDFRNVLKNSIK